MQEHTIRRDSAQDIHFKGELLARASSRRDQGPCKYRWTELQLYQTAGGNYVCVTIGRSMHDNESDRYSAEIVKDSDTAKNDVMSYFGFGILGKSLWDDLGWDAMLEVE